jgi:hypothetical protein
MSKDNIVDLDNDEDFGFTFVGDDDINQKNEIEDLQRRLTELRKMFLPLLMNLNKNPEKEMIKWPNRKELLDKQIKKLKELTKI